MEEFFSYGGWPGFRRFFKKNRIALLYTLIFHLVVLNILIFVRVEGLKKSREAGIAIEFEEKSLEELLADEEVEVSEEWLEEVLRIREQASNRAVNVNAEDAFSEEISTDEYVQELLDQIELARKQEDREKLEELQSILAAADYEPPEEGSGEDQQGEYTGPTTITYEFLDEPRARGKVDLTIPVYRCEGSGIVKVTIMVNRDGRVTDARITEPIVGSDRVCFSNAALDAAKTSRFRIDLNAPENHRAILTYTFIAQ